MSSPWWNLIKTIFSGLFGSGQSGRRASGTTGNKKPARKLSAAQRRLDENMSWLSERWALARAHEGGQHPPQLPSWYFDDSTDRQRQKLDELGLGFPPSASKGQFSDVIGLFADPEPDDVEQLKFFGVKLAAAALSESRVRHELALLNNMPGTAQRWADRPVTKMQKEFYRFAGQKVPTGLTATQAANLIDQALTQLNPEQRDAWMNFVEIVDEFNAPDFCELEGIRKPSLPEIRMAVEALRSGRVNNGELDASEVAEYLLENKPALARA